MNKIKYILLLVVISFLSQVCVAQAFTITPTKYTISLAPGDTQDLYVSAKNDSPQSQTYKPVVMGMTQDEHGRPVFNRNIYAAENWINTKTPIINLATNAKQDFIFSVSVPNNTPPGAHYIGLGVQEENIKGVSARLITVLVLQVSGTAFESLSVEKFLPVKNIFWNSDWQYNLLVKNTGNIELPKVGRADIFYYNGKNIYSQPLNLGNKLFSQSSRQANIGFKLDQTKLWPGEYHVVVTLEYGLTKQQLTNDVNFWYLPLWLVVPIIIIIFIIVLLLKKFSKHAKVE